MIRIAVIMGKMDSGGKKNLVMEYYRHIDRTKIQFDFICDEDSQAIPYDEIIFLGGRIFIVAPYQRILQNMMDIYVLCKKHKYKIMHSYNSTMNLFPILVAKIAGVPIRISESLSMAHENDWKTKIKKILRPMSKWFATHYMSCGEECGRWQFGDKIFEEGKVAVFRTAINTDFNAFDPIVRMKVRKEYGWTDKIVIGHIARFTQQKNSMRLIDIFYAIAQKEPKAVLCLIGDGELKETMMRRIDDLMIGSRVCYLGRREDIQQFYNAMDAFVLPSLYEGLPVVGLEAESCGLPMFFSTEITREANVCELGEFIGLDKSDDYWADRIITSIADNIDNRRSYASEVKGAGFDSKNEAVRLENYYYSVLNNVHCTKSC